ncbi:hypothetical protein BY458DRAFT_525813 [Sporodiniella umbellata]|nr:hypothetical protein BY458DRAFT_525813 [Sporodiniella umbellata]
MFFFHRRNLSQVVRHYLNKNLQPKKRQAWTREEEGRLLTQHTDSWKTTQRQFPHRSLPTLRNKYAQLISQRKALTSVEASLIQQLEQPPRDWHQWRCQHQIPLSLNALKKHYLCHHPTRQGRWTLEEYQQLLSAVTKSPNGKIEWHWISTQVPTRTAAQCQSKWYHAQQPKLGKFSKKEDEALFEAVRTHGPENMQRVKESINSDRSCAALQERYFNYLSPQLDRSPWTNKDRLACIERYRLLGSVDKLFEAYEGKRSKRNLYNLLRSIKK